MRRIILLLSIICILFLSGCGSSAQWAGTILLPVKFNLGEKIPLKVLINQAGAPATGLKVTGVLEMKTMNHGLEKVEFTETSDGVYETTAALPMGGVWLATLKMSKGGKSKEQTLEFKTEGIDRK